MRPRSASAPRPEESSVSGRRSWIVRLSGPILAVVLIVLAEGSACRTSGVPGLSAVILATVLYSTFVGGALAGLVTGAIALGYFAYSESIPGDPIHYTPWHLERVF